MDVRDVREAFLKSDTGATLKLQPREPHKKRIDGALAAPPQEPGQSAPVGVFVTRRVEVDEDLGEYFGEQVRVDKKDELGEFAFRLTDTLALDPAGPNQPPTVLRSACLAHFVNEPRPDQRCTARFLLDRTTRRVTLRTICALDPGDEVLASYGNCRAVSRDSPVNTAQCQRFAPLVVLSETETQRLATVSAFSGKDIGKSTAAVRVRVVESVAPAVRERLAKPLMPSKAKTIERWTEEELDELSALVLQHGVGQWEKKVSDMTASAPGVRRTAAAAAFVWHAKLKLQERHAAQRDAKSLRPDGTAIGWSADERQALIQLIEKDGHRPKDWDKKAAALGTGRSANAVKQYYHKKVRHTADDPCASSARRPLFADRGNRHFSDATRRVAGTATEPPASRPALMLARPQPRRRFVTCDRGTGAGSTSRR